MFVNYGEDGMVVNDSHRYYLVDEVVENWTGYWMHGMLDVELLDQCECDRYWI